jgi:hypothetical protein
MQTRTGAILKKKRVVEGLRGGSRWLEKTEDGVSEKKEGFQWAHTHRPSDAREASNDTRLRRPSAPPTPLPCHGQGPTTKLVLQWRPEPFQESRHPRQTSPGLLERVHPMVVLPTRPVSRVASLFLCSPLVSSASGVLHRGLSLTPIPHSYMHSGGSGHRGSSPCFSLLLLSSSVPPRLLHLLKEPPPVSTPPLAAPRPSLLLLMLLLLHPFCPYPISPRPSDGGSPSPVGSTPSRLGPSRQ